MNGSCASFLGKLVAEAKVEKAAASKLVAILPALQIRHCDCRLLMAPCDADTTISASEAAILFMKIVHGTTESNDMRIHQEQA